MVALGQRNIDHRPLRVRPKRQQMPLRPPAFDLGVDHHPLHIHGAAEQLDTELATHRAGAAVAGQQVAGVGVEETDLHHPARADGQADLVRQRHAQHLAGEIAGRVIGAGRADDVAQPFAAGDEASVDAWADEALAGQHGTAVDLVAVARRVFEMQHAPHRAQGQFIVAGPSPFDVQVAQVLAEGFDRGGIGGLPAGKGQIVGRPLGQDEAVAVLVHAQPAGVWLGSRKHRQAEHIAGKGVPAGQVRHFQADVADLGDESHGGLSCGLGEGFRGAARTTAPAR